jgi:uncharacterized protein
MRPGGPLHSGVAKAASKGALMAEHENTKRLREGYEAFANGDIEKATANFADDIIWHIPAPGPLAGDYKGISEVVGFFGKLVEETGGSFKVNVNHVIADDEYAYAVVDVSAERNGKRLNDKIVHHFRFNSDGKVAEYWTFVSDPQQAIDFWS